MLKVTHQALKSIKYFLSLAIGLNTSRDRILPTENCLGYFQMVKTVRVAKNKQTNKQKQKTKETQ